MSLGKRVAKGVGIAAGVVAGVAGAAYGAQHAVTRSLRRRPDPDAGRLGNLLFDEERRLPSHDGGSIYVVSRGAGRRSCCRTASRSTPASGRSSSTRCPSWGSASSRSTTAGTASRSWARRALAREPRRRRPHRARGARSARRDPRRPLDGWHRRAGVRARSSRRRPCEGRGARAPLDVRAHATRGASSRGPASRVTGWVDLAGIMRRPQLGRCSLGSGSGANRSPATSSSPAGCSPSAIPRPPVMRSSPCSVSTSRTSCTTSRCPRSSSAGAPTSSLHPPKRDASREAIPGARLELFQRAGHMVMLERADELHALLLDFAREVGVLPTAEAASA